MDPIRQNVIIDWVEKGTHLSILDKDTPDQVLGLAYPAGWRYCPFIYLVSVCTSYTLPIHHRTPSNCISDRAPEHTSDMYISIPWPALRLKLCRFPLALVQTISDTLVQYLYKLLIFRKIARSLCARGDLA